MWILFALGSALFAGLTAILAKCGVRRTDSTVATAIRTVIVLAFAWLMVFLTGAQAGLGAVRGEAVLYLILSGLATGASWLCYFKALQLGDVNKVTPIDKSSTVLTILLALLLFREPVSGWKALGVLCVGAGTWMMIEKKASSQAGNGPWLPYALASALFASLTAILGKLGVGGMDSNLASAIRTVVVLVMAWGMVFAAGKVSELKAVPREELRFICLSGIATGASWLCYYRALRDGPASVVVPIDKLSILVTVAFSRLVLRERLSRRAALGLALVTAGTMALLLG